MKIYKYYNGKVVPVEVLKETDKCYYFIRTKELDFHRMLPKEECCLTPEEAWKEEYDLTLSLVTNARKIYKIEKKRLKRLKKAMKERSKERKE